MNPIAIFVEKLFFFLIRDGISPVTINSQEKDRESRFDEISERLNVSFESNAQWYLNDKKFEDIKEDTERLRANSYLRIDYQISDRFSSGFQLESYAPEPLLNYSKIFDEEIGLGTFYLNYNTKKLDITLGYYYVRLLPIVGFIHKHESTIQNQPSCHLVEPSILKTY